MGTRTTPKMAKGDKTEGDLLEINQAVAMLKTTRSTFYRWMSEGKIRGLKVGRRWRFKRAEIERFLKGEELRIEVRSDVTPLLQVLSARARELKAPQASLLSDTELQQAVKLIIEVGMALGASDIHLSTHEFEKEMRSVLRYRVDGVLHEVACFDPRILAGIVEQWKVFANMDLHEKGPQDGRIKFDVAGQAHMCDVRVSILPAQHGPSLTARILRYENRQFELGQAGYAPRDKEKILQAIHAPHGFIVVTGPTGTGKTVLLYSCLQTTNDPQRKIMTVEDPVEWSFPYMVQVQVNEREGITFGRAIRSFLRSDPDVILVGEIRDNDVLQICFQTALTGHLVYSTLHADDAPGALVRMLNIGAAPFLVADTVKIVIAQRLVRLLCPDCGQPETLPPHQWTRAETVARSGGLDWVGLAKNFRRPVGCSTCKRLGYCGRTVIAEVLEMTPEIGSALRRGASVDELRSIAVGQGMTTMAADGIRKAAEGKTTLDEVFRMLALR
jgi:type IV pilus assembly protein PilB